MSKWLSVGEMASELKCSKGAVYYRASTGQLERNLMDGSYMFRMPEKNENKDVNLIKIVTIEAIIKLRNNGISNETVIKMIKTLLED